MAKLVIKEDSIIKRYPEWKKYIGKNTNLLIKEQTSEEWIYIKTCDIIGVAGYINITLRKVNTRVEVVCALIENRLRMES